MHRPDNSHLIVLDTLGKLYAHGYGVNGYCRPCRRYFGVPMPVLIAARGGDARVVGMRSLSSAPAAAGGRRRFASPRRRKTAVRAIQAHALPPA